MAFISNEHRHGKTILALGASQALFEKAGVPPTLASGKADPGIVMGTAAKAGSVAAGFVNALGKHAISNVRPVHGQSERSRQRRYGPAARTTNGQA